MQAYHKYYLDTENFTHAVLLNNSTLLPVTTDFCF